MAQSRLYTDTMAVVNVHLCDSLQVLSYKLKMLGETSGAGEDADASALERDFGFTPKITLREGLRKFAAWYKEYYQK